MTIYTCIPVENKHSHYTPVQGNCPLIYKKHLNVVKIPMKSYSIFPDHIITWLKLILDCHNLKMLTSVLL